MKEYVKRAALLAAAACGRHRWPVGRPGLLVLMYHRVLPRADHVAWHEQPGMVLDPATLDRQLGWLKRHFDVVRLSEWLQLRAEGKPLPRRACALTFDDGWRDNHQYAHPVLKAHGLPATIYLVAEHVGSARWFWPNRAIRVFTHLRGHASERQPSPGLDWLRGALGNPPGFPSDAAGADAAIAQLKALPDIELSTRLEQVEAELSLPPAERTMLNWEEVREMAGSGLVDFGSHTCRHVRMLPGLEPGLLEYEVVESRRIIERETGRPVLTFCYPNGNMTPAADRLVRAHYAGAITTQKGWNAPGQDPYTLRRIGIHQGAAATSVSFQARISGMI